MDIAALSMTMTQDKILSDFSTAMLANSLDIFEQNGDMLCSLIDAQAMERSVNPDIGSMIDISI